MASLGLVSMAIASAIAGVPQPHYNTQYSEVKHIVSEPEEATEAEIQELTERIFMAEKNLSGFYQLAKTRLSIFESFAEGELMSLFKESARLLFSTKQYAEEGSLMFEYLTRFEDSLNKLTKLFQSYEYKKEADRVLLSRVNSPIVVSFDKNSSDEELRQFIFG